MFGVLQDVTELRKAEEERRATEPRFRTLVEHTTDALFVTNDRDTVIDVNRQACESLGYSREELIGMTPYDFDRSGDAAAMRALWLRMRAGEVVTFETYHWHKDGTRFPVEVRAREFEQNGRRSLLLARDITERKRAEQRTRVQHSVAQLLFGRGCTGGNCASAPAGDLRMPGLGHRRFVAHRSRCVCSAVRTPLALTIDRRRGVRGRYAGDELRTTAPRRSAHQKSFSSTSAPTSRRVSCSTCVCRDRAA